MIDQLLNIIAILAWAWFVLVVVMIALRSFQGGGVRSLGRALFSWRVGIALIVAVLMSLISASLVFIEPQEVGVVISVISPNGYRDEPLRSGLHLVVPLAERVVRYPIYWQTYTMSQEATEGAKTGNDAISARTSDGQLVYVDSSVIYKIDGNEVIRIHIDLQNRYVDDFIRPVMRSVIRTEVSQFTADEINSSKRKDLESNLGDLLRQAFAAKGFTLDRFLLRNIAFSPQYTSAIEQKQVSEQQKLQAQYQAQQMRELAAGERDKTIEEAKGKANAVQIQAQADANAAVVKAKAEQQALQLIAQALQNNKNLLLYRYIEKLSPGIKVMLVPNNNPYLLNLPDLSNIGAGASTSYTGTITATLGISNTLVPLPTPSP
jgi:regulator of protease activity HflC (stomatin/prohibitin superfamily)